jgi:hypothetical protein
MAGVFTFGCRLAIGIGAALGTTTLLLPVVFSSD